MIYSKLSARWRQDAELLRRHGATEAATTKEACAAELKIVDAEHQLETLTLRDAARESGYGPDHLGRLITEGRLTNAGSKGSPRIRRQDLPRKLKPPPKPPAEPDLVGVVLDRQGGRV